MKYDMILFDVDGTIWDVSKILTNSFNAILEKHDIERRVTLEEIKGALGLNAKNFANKVLYFIEDENLRLEYLHEIDDDKHLFIRNNYVKPYPRFHRTIKELAKRYKVGIVSNCGAGTIEQLIDKLQIKNYITDFIAASVFKISKAEAIRRVVDRNDAENAIYIGDTILDKEASNEANVEFIHAKYGFGKDLENDNEINSYDELIPLIREMENKK